MVNLNRALAKKVAAWSAASLIAFAVALPWLGTANAFQNGCCCEDALLHTFPAGNCHECAASPNCGVPPFDEVPHYVHGSTPCVSFRPASTCSFSDAKATPTRWKCTTVEECENDPGLSRCKVVMAGTGPDFTYKKCDAGSNNCVGPNPVPVNCN